LPASSFFLSHQPKYQMPTDFIEFASCDMWHWCVNRFQDEYNMEPLLSNDSNSSQRYTSNRKRTACK
jgi:hypothetical protein